MSFRIDYADIVAAEMVRQIGEQKEAILLSQLQELVSRGLLVIEKGELTLVEEYDPMTHMPKIQFRQTVEFKLKDQEYIEQLEAKVKSLEAKVKSLEESRAAIKKAIGG